jgi:hypothetical protein
MTGLEIGNWNLGFGIWNLEFGIWNLEIGIWDFLQRSLRYFVDRFIG